MGEPGARPGELARIADALEKLVGLLGSRPAPEIVREAPVMPTTGPVEYVTQKNCMQVLGLTPRRFLELVRRDDAPPVVAVGKVRMVRRDVMLAYVERRRVRASSEVGADGAAAVLAEVGCAPVPRRR